MNKASLVKIVISFLTAGFFIVRWIFTRDASTKRETTMNNQINSLPHYRRAVSNQSSMRSGGQTSMSSTSRHERNIVDALISVGGHSTGKIEADRASVDEEMEINGEFLQVLEALRSRDKSPILVTGKAGTGKSTLVRYIKTCGEFPNTVVLAPTGIAAINISGQTIHSFFRLPPRIIDREELARRRSNRLWRKVQLIIIDEVSMVRADVLDAIDLILRNQRNSEFAFGGCQILFVGDFFQLPPVTTNEEAEILKKMGYRNFYAYGAEVLKSVDLRKVSLEKVYRQNERDFLEILSNLRLAQEVTSTLNQLNSVCVGAHRAEHIPLHLTATNATSAMYNRSGLAKIDEPSSSFEAKTTGKFNLSKSMMPAPEFLELKVGARVMALKNDLNKRWVNGSLGTVVSLAKSVATVRFDDLNEDLVVPPATWENIIYIWEDELGKPVAEVVGSYTQVPLNLAWALTIHKAQGLTLDDVRIDLEGGAFAAGQTYVALSRAKNMNGLSLTRPLVPSDVIVETKHLEFLYPQLQPFESASNPSIDPDLNEPERTETTHQLLQDELHREISETTLPDQVRVIRSFGRSKPKIPIFEAENFDFEDTVQLPIDFEYFIGIDYADKEGTETYRELKAHSLLHLPGLDAWYLVGHCFLRNEPRIFRLDRIASIHDKNAQKIIDNDIENYLMNLGLR